MRRTIEALRNVFAVVLWVAIAFVLLSSGKALAANLGPKAPDPSDSYYWSNGSYVVGPNNSVHTFLLRKNSNRGVNPRLSLIAYYPSGVTGWNQKYIQIEQEASWNCESYADSGTAKVKFMTVKLSSGGNEDDYSIPYVQQNGGNICTIRNVKNTADAIGPGGSIIRDSTNTFFAKYRLPAQPAAPNNDTGLYQVNIDIAYDSSVPTPDSRSGDNNSIQFRVVGYDGDGTTTGGLKIGPNGTNNGSYNFPILGRPAYNNISTKIAIPFGLPCRDDTPVTKTVGLYDADNGGAFSETVRFRVRDIDLGNPSNVDFYQETGGTPNGDTINNPSNFQNTSFTPNNGNKGEATVQITMRPHHRYELVVTGLDGGNTVVVSLPTDTIYGTIQCPVVPPPSITCDSLLMDSPISPTEKEIASLLAHSANYTVNGLTAPASINVHFQSLTNTDTGSPFPKQPDTSVPRANGLYSGSIFVGQNFPVGNYHAVIVISDPSSPNINDTCSGDFMVAGKPYLSIYGGDAEAGVAPQYDGSVFSKLPPNNSASFVGWNDGPGSWGSAGAQWAVQALGSIVGFPSGRGVGPTTTVPWYLSFANTTHNATNGYGGAFVGTSNVTIDYRDYINAPGVVNANLGGPGPYELGSQVVSTQTIVARGNIYISGPLIYNTGIGWVNTAAIPSYKLISLGGNIYIKNDVNELDGTYMAIPTTSGTGGNIYTCSIKLGPGSYAAYDTAGGASYVPCNHQLKIYGAVVAKHVYFGRTFDSFANQNQPWSGTTAAESIIYGPESWLSTGTGAPGNYSAITGLPPIL